MMSHPTSHQDGYDNLALEDTSFQQMKPEERERWCSKMARRMAGIPWEAKMRAICRFFQIDPFYGAGVAKAIGIDISQFSRAIEAAAKGSG